LTIVVNLRNDVKEILEGNKCPFGAKFCNFLPIVLFILFLKAGFFPGLLFFVAAS